MIPYINIALEVVHCLGCTGYRERFWGGGGDVKREMGIFSLNQKKRRKNRRNISRDWMEHVLLEKLWLTKHTEKET
jgi:hypothetical protein